MKIDVSDLLKKKVAKKDLSLQLEVSSFYDGSETVNVLKPIKIDGFLKAIGDILQLDCTVETELEFTCGRCLKKFSEGFTILISEKFSTKNSVSKDDEVIFIDSDTIDITEIIVNNIILNLPMKRLCSENCKGLCPQCGKDLNISTCTCEKDDIDPRLAKLKDIFFTD